MSLLPDLNFKQRKRLVTALTSCARLSNQQSQDQFVNQLPDEVRSRINRFPNDLQDVDSILLTCLSFEAAWRQLFEVIRFYEGAAAKSWRQLESVINDIEQG